MSKTKIVRTPQRAAGGITPAEKLAMDDIAREWTKIAMRTDPIRPDKIVPAIHALYAAAGMPCKRVVIVPSPLVMAFAYGAAAWIWHSRKDTADATRAATAAATDEATDEATYAATRAATYAATAAATYAATDEATAAATSDATADATYEATAEATADATADATRAATDEATAEAIQHRSIGAARACKDIAGARGIACARRWWRTYQGGNMWSPVCAYYAAMRDVVGLHLPQFQAYAAWEACAREGAFRIMHEEFCMVSDFPAEIHIDDQNRPHNDTGPSHRWRDGWSLYHVHGVRVPADVVESPHLITVERITNEGNAEVRRVMIDRYGAARYLLDSGAKVIARDDYGVLYRQEVPQDEPIVMVRVLNTTPESAGSLSQEDAERVFGPQVVQRSLDIMKAIGHLVASEPRWKEYMLRVPPTISTAHEAVAWTFGKTPEHYAPSIES